VLDHDPALDLERQHQRADQPVGAEQGLVGPHGGPERAHALGGPGSVGGAGLPELHALLRVQPEGDDGDLGAKRGHQHSQPVHELAESDFHRGGRRHRERVLLQAEQHSGPDADQLHAQPQAAQVLVQQLLLGRLAPVARAQPGPVHPRGLRQLVPEHHHLALRLLLAQLPPLARHRRRRALLQSRQRQRLGRSAASRPDSSGVELQQPRAPSRGQALVRVGAVRDDDRNIQPRAGDLDPLGLLVLQCVLAGVAQQRGRQRRALVRPVPHPVDPEQPNRPGHQLPGFPADLDPLLLAAQGSLLLVAETPHGLQDLGRTAHRHRVAGPE